MLLPGKRNGATVLSHPRLEQAYVVSVWIDAINADEMFTQIGDNACRLSDASKSDMWKRMEHDTQE